ncbi:MAG: MBL fold metallo-hydrolase [Candidatus Margulisiibacteriota bacterium]
MKTIRAVIGLLLTVQLAGAAAGKEVIEMGAVKDGVKITVVFDNKTVSKDYEAGYGFACVVEKNGKKILFDTGCCGKTLLSNMKKAGIKPKEINIIVLSHSHWDHTGGLFDFLKENSNVTVYVLPSFSKKFKQEIKNSGAKFKESAGYTEIIKGVFTTGELGSKIKEQSLIIDSSEGPVLITGCAHPGIVSIVKSAEASHKQSISVILGGLHLMEKSSAQTDRIITSLKKLGIKKVVPLHCTGDRQSRMIIKEFGAGDKKTGAGSKIKI